jgi:hypothetical protein
MRTWLMHEESDMWGPLLPVKTLVVLLPQMLISGMQHEWARLSKCYGLNLYSFHAATSGLENICISSVH